MVSVSVELLENSPVTLSLPCLSHCYHLAVISERKPPSSLSTSAQLSPNSLHMTTFVGLDRALANARSSPTKVVICNEFGDNCADVLKDEGGFLSLMTARW